MQRWIGIVFDVVTALIAVEMRDRSRQLLALSSPRRGVCIEPGALFPSLHFVLFNSRSH